MLHCTRLAIFLIAGLVAATGAHAADRIGLYGEWGAFRDRAVCYALRLPQDADVAPGAYLSLTVTKARAPQFVVRLATPRSEAASASASVGGRRFALSGTGRELRAPDARVDRALVSAIRSARALTIETVSESGSAVVNGYDLRGAASAIDAARLACR